MECIKRMTPEPIHVIILRQHRTKPPAGLQPILCAGNAPISLEIHKVFLREIVFFQGKIARRVLLWHNGIRSRSSNEGSK